MSFRAFFFLFLFAFFLRGAASESSGDTGDAGLFEPEFSFVGSVDASGDAGDAGDAGETSSSSLGLTGLLRSLSSFDPWCH